MRYTTIIDISENSMLYRNYKARILYLHMALKAGYHDDDRDILDISLRNLAAASGLTLSATRHALKQLESAHLIERQGPVFHVKKWVEEQTITTRAKTQKKQKEAAARARLGQELEARQLQLNQERATAELLLKQGKTNFMVYYEGLLKKAEAGDMEAAATVAKQRKTYEAHVKAVQEQNKTKQKT